MTHFNTRGSLIDVVYIFIFTLDYLFECMSWMDDDYGCTVDGFFLIDFVECFFCGFGKSLYWGST